MKIERFWTDEEINFLKTNYNILSRDEMCKQLQWSKESIRNKAWNLKLISIPKITDPSINALFNSYIADAKDRKREFKLTKEEFKKIITKNCYYCGIEPRNFNRYVSSKTNKKRSSISQKTIDKAWIKVNGIDRINNDKGYINENCVPCCGNCNRAKYNQTQDDFIQWINQLIMYRSK